MKSSRNPTSDRSVLDTDYPANFCLVYWVEGLGRIIVGVIHCGRRGGSCAATVNAGVRLSLKDPREGQESSKARTIMIYVSNATSVIET